MLALCLPAGASARPEHHALFPSDHVDLQGKGGRLELLRRLHVQLRAWKDLLRRFLKSNDDQARAGRHASTHSAARSPPTSAASVCRSNSF